MERIIENLEKDVAGGRVIRMNGCKLVVEDEKLWIAMLTEAGLLKVPKKDGPSIKQDVRDVGLQLRSRKLEIKVHKRGLFN